MKETKGERCTEKSTLYLFALLDETASGFQRTREEQGGQTEERTGLKVNSLSHEPNLLSS